MGRKTSTPERGSLDKKKIVVYRMNKKIIVYLENECGKENWSNEN
jgi:hypothetical protein